MTNSLRFALAQLNPTVGALRKNLQLALDALDSAVAAQADVLLFPELFLTGYFPEDLLLKPRFVADAMQVARDFAEATAGRDISVLMPTVWLDEGTLRNAVLLIEDGAINDWRFKHELPNNDVFYEKRYFLPADLPEPMTICGVEVGVPICEDIWHKPVCSALAQRGAEILVCPNGSPYWRNRHLTRETVVRDRVEETGLPLLYLNQVGGQDELVFDGASFGMDGKGNVVFQGRSFEPDLVISDWQRDAEGWHCVKGETVPLVSADEAPWRAAVLGLRDYVHKNGFESVVVGLSGGIDSAVTAAIATDAFGPDKVHCIMLPYRYTSSASLEDARACAERLGVRYDTVPIGGGVEGINDSLAALFEGRKPDITEENIQARVRGVTLMAVSNKLGGMLLTTGNKSELAVGYATIYGDMNGGFNPIKDMLKTQVYHLAAWRNAHMPGDCLGPEGEVVPPAIISKAPTAELRADQKDQDSLPDYEVLDAILEGLVEEELSVVEVVDRGFDLALVRRIERMLYIAEYKRRQAGPGVKLTPKAFGIGRKYPVTNGYRDESTE